MLGGNLGSLLYGDVSVMISPNTFISKGLIFNQVSSTVGNVSIRLYASDCRILSLLSINFYQNLALQQVRSLKN